MMATATGSAMGLAREIPWTVKYLLAAFVLGLELGLKGEGLEDGNGDGDGLGGGDGLGNKWAWRGRW